MVETRPATSGATPAVPRWGTAQHPHPLQRRLAVAGRAVRDRPRHQVLAREVVGVERMGGVGVGVELVDRHPLLLPELLVEIAPVGREVRAVVVPRRHGEVAHLQHVAGLGVLDPDRAGHDVDAWIAIALRNGVEDGGDALVHHQLGRVAGVMGDRLGLDQVAALHLQHRREGGVEIAPVHRLRRSGQVVQGAWRRGAAGFPGLADQRHSGPRW